MNVTKFDKELVLIRASLSVEGSMEETKRDLHRLIYDLSDLKYRYVAKRWDALFELVIQLPDQDASALLSRLVNALTSKEGKSVRPHHRRTSGTGAIPGPADDSLSPIAPNQALNPIQRRLRLDRVERHAERFNVHDYYGLNHVFDGLVKGGIERAMKGLGTTQVERFRRYADRAAEKLVDEPGLLSFAIFDLGQAILSVEESDRVFCYDQLNGYRDTFLRLPVGERQFAISGLAVALLSLPSNDARPREQDLGDQLHSMFGSPVTRGEWLLGVDRLHRQLLDRAAAQESLMLRSQSPLSRFRARLTGITNEVGRMAQSRSRRH